MGMYELILRTLFCPFELFLAAGAGASAGERNRHPNALSLRTTSMKAAVGERTGGEQEEGRPPDR
jgi:hypothetical protein